MVFCNRALDRFKHEPTEGNLNAYHIPRAKACRDIRWATDNGFQFSKTKIVCMHICQKRGLHLDPQLFLDQSLIPVVEETKVLGVYLTGGYPLYPNLNVKKKGLKTFNILNIIGNTEWGADRKVMLRLYRSLVSLGAFRTSSVENLYINAQC